MVTVRHIFRLALTSDRLHPSLKLLGYFILKKLPQPGQATSIELTLGDKQLLSDLGHPPRAVVLNLGSIAARFLLRLRWAVSHLRSNSFSDLGRKLQRSPIN